MEGVLSEDNYGVNFVKGTPRTRPFDSGSGAGTHSAGIVKKVFPHVRILPLKIYSGDSEHNRTIDVVRERLRGMVRALKYALNKNVDIISLSFGGPIKTLEERFYYGPIMKKVRNLIDEAGEKGILVVQSAGEGVNEWNLNKQPPSAFHRGYERSEIEDIDIRRIFPARFNRPHMLTVTSHDKDLLFAPASANWGNKNVHISAPGIDILSSVPNGRSWYKTGTQSAAAYAVGVAALLRSHFPQLSAQEIKEILVRSARRQSFSRVMSSFMGHLAVSKEKSNAITDIMASYFMYRGKFRYRCSARGCLDAERAIDLADEYSKWKIDNQNGKKVFALIQKHCR